VRVDARVENDRVILGWTALARSCGVFAHARMVPDRPSRKRVPAPPSRFVAGPPGQDAACEW
jgi:hypothetical protein